MPCMESYEALPGADLVGAGLSDLTAGVEPVAALLVAIGAPRLRQFMRALEGEAQSPVRVFERAIAAILTS
jgi:hypothetical protein